MNVISVDRRVLASLMVAGVFAVAPHALELPLWIIAVFAAGAAWRVTGSPARAQAPKPPSSRRTVGWPKYSRNQKARAALMPDWSS